MAFGSVGIIKWACGGLVWDWVGLGWVLSGWFRLFGRFVRVLCGFGFRVFGAAGWGGGLECP